MKKRQKNEYLRIKNAVCVDKKLMANTLNVVLKEEIYFVLCNYFDIERNNCFVDFDIDDNGKYDLKIFAKADRYKNVNCYNLGIKFDDE